MSVTLVVGLLIGAPADGKADRPASALVPVVSGVDPASGATVGNIRITVSGSNFFRVRSVVFGATKGTSVEVISASRLTVVVPSHVAGRVIVAVTTSYGVSKPGYASHYTYTADEFNNPSESRLPRASAYNRTPMCTLSATDYDQCTVQPSAQPPRDPNNPERYLNSAYWPAEKRPDIEMYAIQRYGYDYKNCSARLPHYCFLVDAIAVGYPVTHTPRVGDLWLAPCNRMTWDDGATPSCGANPNDEWYLGYVERVFPDGSFIQSWGGSDTAADTGLAETWFSGSMDRYTDFIGLMPAKSKRPA